MDKFWEGHAERFASGDKLVVIVDGTHYRIGAHDHGMKGFGGHKWKIRFNDGRIVDTDNLWYQGKIPDDYLERLPNNAVFLQG